MERIYLKNGTIMDGTGSDSYPGNLLIEGDRIAAISRTDLAPEGCRTIDCTGKVIAPGFIDAHSHQDAYIYYTNDLEMTEPFLRQGVTTHVGGNCGLGPAGLMKNSPFRQEVFRRRPEFMEENSAPWETYADYFDYLRKKGIRSNLATLAAHGTALASIVGYNQKGPTSPENLKILESILNEGMDAGCKGISCGIAYAPGIHLPDQEFRQVAEWAKKRDKVIAFHTRTYSTELPEFYGDDYRIPHNVRWQKEFLELFRDSGIKLQLSHLIFSGRTAFDTFDQMMAVINEMTHAGFDLWFDMFSYIQSSTYIMTMMPKFFMDHIPEIYTDKSLWPQLEKEMEVNTVRKGKLPSDVIVCDPLIDDYQKYKGMTLDMVMKDRGMTATELYMDMYRRSNGFAWLFHLVAQREADIPREMAHPRCLYMLDCWVQPGAVQSACVYGGMVKFLRLTRETGVQSMEEAIAKMTGRVAKRFSLDHRGLLREGYFADVTVFDPLTVADTATPQDPVQDPIGIEHVFINGLHVLDEGKLDTSLKAGRVV